MDNKRNMGEESGRDFYKMDGRMNERGFGGRDNPGGHEESGGREGRGGRGEYGGREGRSSIGGRGNLGSHGGGFYGHGGAPGQMLAERLGGDETAILVFVGSLNCIRHKPYMRIGEMMQDRKAAILCPSMSDFSSGRYLNQIVDAVVELSKERGTKHFVLTYGCQWVILSTDGDLLVQRLKNEYDIDLKLWEDSHLEFGDHE